MLTAMSFDDHASQQILLGAPLVEFRERLLALHAAAGPRMSGDSCSGVSPSALLQSLLSIGGGELNFKLMDLISERPFAGPPVSPATVARQTRSSSVSIG